MRRRLRPGDLRAAGDRVGAEARAMPALPAEALVLDGGAFGLRADERRIARAVGLAEGVAAGDQRDGFLVVHRHAGEGLADVPRRRDRIRLAVGAFRIDVDEAHLHRAERLLQLAFAAVALVAEPRALGPPEELFGLPHIGAAAGEAEGLEAHRLQRDVAGEDHQVGPGELAAVLLLDRPQQAPRLVEVRVVGPAVERREALLPGAGAAAAVGDAVGAGAMPGHADEQSAVVAEVRRPPVLRVGHQGMQVLDHGVQVEALELLGVVELLAHRIGQRESCDAGSGCPAAPATSRGSCVRVPPSAGHRQRPRRGTWFHLSWSSPIESSGCGTLGPLNPELPIDWRYRGNSLRREPQGQARSAASATARRLLRLAPSCARIDMPWRTAV